MVKFSYRLSLHYLQTVKQVVFIDSFISSTICSTGETLKDTQKDSFKRSVKAYSNSVCRNRQFNLLVQENVQERSLKR